MSSENPQYLLCRALVRVSKYGVKTTNIMTDRHLRLYHLCEYYCCYYSCDTMRTICEELILQMSKNYIDDKIKIKVWFREENDSVGEFSQGKFFHLKILWSDNFLMEFQD